jgi:antitoxin VapB
MSLNIKNERVHALAREAARLTGKSQTSAIEEALEALVARFSEAEREKARLAKLELLFAEIQATVTDQDRAAMQRVMDEMYDENGLPR